MLARQQSRRHHDRDLLAVHRGHEGRPQRDLGLAEADVAADQPVHRLSRGQLAQRHIDRGLLVLRFLVGKAGTKLVIGSLLDRQPGCLAQLPLGSNLDQLTRDLADTALHARLARLPGTATEPVEIDQGLLRTIAGEQLEILHRQEQLVAAGIVQLETVVRRTGGLDRAQPDKTADAVVDVDHEVAGGEAGHLGDEILGAP